MFGDAMILLIIILPVVEINIFISLNKRWKKSGRFGENRKSISIGLCLLTIAVTMYLLNASDYRRSKVDVSPMAELTIEQVYALEGLVKEFEDYDFVRRFKEYDTDTYKKTTAIYDFSWRNPDSGPERGIGVTMLFYIEESDVINRLRTEYHLWGGKYKTIKYDNDTEAVLFHARVTRNEFSLGASWEQTSYIRFGNALIIISGGVREDIPGEFIQWLCELIIDADAQQQI